MLYKCKHIIHIIKERIDTQMEKYCVKRAKREDWGYNKQGSYYSLTSIMEHIMNDMAKEGWTVRSTCYEDVSEIAVLITFAKQI